MGWLSSFFSFDSSSQQRLRKGQVFSSTHEAFSLPSSSPIYNMHPDAFNPDSLASPPAQSQASYTYPPQGSASHGYIPSSNGVLSRGASSSLLPTHMDPLHTPLSSTSGYPPLSKTWARLRSWLGREYPELGDTLNYGILPEDLAQIEMQFGFALPAVVRESYLCADGQEAESAAGCSEGLFFGLTLLPLEDVLEEWRFWREVDRDPTTGANDALRKSMNSIPPGWIKKEYSQRGWIPLVADKAGNYLGVDLSPGESGSIGQVIVFGRDFDTKVVLWKGDGLTGWAKWLASFVEELESGDGFEIGATEAGEGSEDDLGYESYFYDGNGRGQGDVGGDTGTGGGLRYTNEYRGWNVFEAWADRSVRKWHATGVISDEMLSPIQENTKDERKDLDIVELSMQGPGAADIAIPILNDPSDHIPSPTLEAFSHHAHTTPQPGPSKHNLPTISVTKPPAPLPVALPTPNDIAPLPSPPDSGHSSLDGDLESGRPNLNMREVFEDVGLVSATRRIGKAKASVRRETSDASESALPPSSPTIMSHSPTPSSSKQKSVAPLIEDLLTDLAPTLDKDSFSPQILSENSSLNKSQLKSGTSNDLDGDASPDTTIRLVGGGGEAGIAQSPITRSVELVEEPKSEVPEEDEVISDHTKVSGAKSTSSEKTHRRQRSNFSKKLAQIGLVKSDSKSSMKEIVSPPVT